MAIYKRDSNKFKGGYSYTVQIPYIDEHGVKQRYNKSGFETKKAADEHERKIKDELANKGKIKKEISRTLNELVDEYLRVERSSMKLNTYLDYTRVYNHHARDSIGNYLVNRLEYKDFKQHFNDLGKRFGRSVLVQLKSVINNAYIYAIRNSYIEPFNPIQYLKVTTYKVKPKKFLKTLTTGQFEEILDYCDQSDRNIAESYKIALYIGYYTGMRKAEILALNKTDVDLINCTIDINKQIIRGEHKNDTTLQLSPKTEASTSSIPIAIPLRDILQDWFLRNPYELVVPDKNGQYINPDNITGFCAHMSSVLGFHFNFHMLRHTFTTNLIDNGASPKIVQTLDRHANISTTLNYYDHVSMDKQNEALKDMFGDTEKEKRNKNATFLKS